MTQVVVITGRTCTGKSKLALQLETEFGYARFRTSEFIKEWARENGRQTDRQTLQKIGDELDSETSHKWLFDAVLSEQRASPKSTYWVVDNVRNAQQLEYFRGHHDWSLIHVHLYARTEDLKERFAKKCENRPGEKGHEYVAADLIKKTDDIDHFKRDADVRINTSRSDGNDTLVRVGARLRLFSAPDVRCVDVVVGGQYGSEGKGHVAAYLADQYNVLVRVGGPNAGHTVASKSGVYTYHQLPSGARDTNAKLLLGPGMTIRVEELLKEIHECGVTPERLFIDPQAMIIEQVDIDREKELVTKIGSTGRGGGSAAARRIMGRKPDALRLAKDVSELKPYVGDAKPFRGSTVSQLEAAYQRGEAILLEGTQGSGLSIYHGQFPYVTSRETNVAGCLAEAGISPGRVRKILMVIRPTPIRVGHPEVEGGNSGFLKHEVTFREVAEQAGLDPDEVEKLEKTSTTKRNRRVGWFDWEQFRLACALNAPTDIVLTFADYIDSKNQKARRFEQLTEDTIKFIEEIERVAQAPVSLINTRFPREAIEKIDLRTVIDRRNWSPKSRG